MSSDHPSTASIARARALGVQSPPMKVKAIAPWFGSNRGLADEVGKYLGACDWVGIPFMGGASEIPGIVTRAGVANDLHRHVINLARVISDPDMKPKLAEKLVGMLFHEDELAEAQRECLDKEAASGLWGGQAIAEAGPNVKWAASYFVCCWMGRSATAGTTNEFRSSLATRWSSSGGDSAKRFRSAVDSLDAWHAATLHWTFTADDAFEFLGRCVDQEKHGIYIDAPWPDAGEEYRHRFSDQAQRRLAKMIQPFTRTRVVIRYGDHPLIREIYPEGQWNWIRQTSRSQANEAVEEVLILNPAATIPRSAK